MIDTIVKGRMVVPIKERLGIEELLIVKLNLDNDCIDEYYEVVNALIGWGLYTYAPKKLDRDE